MNKIKSFIQLIRVRQYYKNVILFIGIIFAGKIFDFSLYPQIFLAFLLVCIASSSIYIINDIKDREVDRIHPEKLEKRPLARGDISLLAAYIILIIFLALIITAIILFNNLFSLMLILILLNGLAYNFIFKQIAFADIISLSTIYIWRALAGCAIIDVRISSWLTITIFLAALLLATGKRIADLSLLGEKEAKNHKKTYDQYSQKILDFILVIVSTALFMTYTLYSVLGPTENDSIVPIENKGLLVYSTPIALFLIIRFIYLIHAKPKIARHSEQLIKDRPMVIGTLFLGFMIFVLLYLEISEISLNGLV